MLDPTLTPLGEQQCHKLCTEFPLHDSIDLLVSSPLRRTMYTTLLSFKPETERGLRVIALPELQEVGDFPCDTGSDVEVLKSELAGKPVDLSYLPDDWNSKKGYWGSSEDLLNKRVSKVRQWLKARPEKNIVVITHGGLVHYLTDDWNDSDKFPGTGWDNTEFRSYRFVDEEGPNEAFAELEESRRRRIGTEKPLTDAEQTRLEEVKSKS